MYSMQEQSKTDGKVLLQTEDVCLGVTAKGKDLKEARANAYEATEWIDFENKYTCVMII